MKCRNEGFVRQRIIIAVTVHETHSFNGQPKKPEGSDGSVFVKTAILMGGASAPKGRFRRRTRFRFDPILGSKQKRVRLQSLDQMAGN